MEDRKFYAVLKLTTEIEYINPITQDNIICKLGGLAGYIPVFETIEEAEQSAQNGKYKIVQLEHNGKQKEN